MNIPNEKNIDLWFINDQSITDQGLLNEYQQWLSPSEKKKYERFSNDTQRHQYLITRALVRSVLSLYVPKIRPECWHFDREPYGKPFIKHEALPSHLSFNLSHTQQMITLAVGTNIDIGVDVEWINRPGFTRQFAEHYFDKSEITALNRLDEAYQRGRIFDLWTLKEAYIKARGMGLRLSLNSVIYHFLDNKQLDVTFNQKQQETLNNWTMCLFHIATDQEYRIALAVKSYLHQSSHSINTYEHIPGKEWNKRPLTLLYSNTHTLA